MLKVVGAVLSSVGTAACAHKDAPSPLRDVQPEVRVAEGMAAAISGPPPALCCCSVAKLCPTLCNPMDCNCSTPGFP